MVKIEKRFLQRAEMGGANQSLVDSESVVWTDDNGPLRLVRLDRGDQPPAYRIDGHPDDNATYASVSFESDDAEHRARLYLAVLLEAAHRPPDDPAHFVPTPLLTAPRRYHSAFLTAATTNSTLWVARTLNVDRETVYAHISRVRSDYPEIFDENGE